MKKSIANVLKKYVLKVLMLSVLLMLSGCSKSDANQAGKETDTVATSTDTQSDKPVPTSTPTPTPTPTPEAVDNVEPGGLSEDMILEYFQEKYGCPHVEVDHYEDDLPVIHLYEVIENSDESHTATIAWFKVNPYTGASENIMTGEVFFIPLSLTEPIPREIQAGVYYDKEVYESGDFDAEFVGVALNQDGKALMTIQDFGWGTWTRGGVLTLNHRLDSKQKITAGEDCITLENGEVLVKAPVNAWPKGFDEFMKSGKIPYWMTDMIWQDDYRSILLGSADEKTKGYFLYDIDKDDMPELIIKSGTCEADYCGTVYSADENGNAYYVGDLQIGNTFLHSDPGENGMVLQWVGMGTNMFHRLSLENGKLIFEKVLEENAARDGGEYTEVDSVFPGSKELEYIDINDTQALYNYREK